MTAQSHDLSLCQSVSQKQLSEITRNASTWEDFLRFSARFYKYWFPAQLLIYAQNRNATACATKDLWIDRMKREISIDAKPILVFSHGHFDRTETIFDVKDTVAIVGSFTPNPWVLLPKERNLVSDRLGAAAMTQGRIHLKDRLRMMIQQHIYAAQRDPAIADTVGCIVFSRANLPIENSMITSSFTAIANLSAYGLLQHAIAAQEVSHAILSSVSAALISIRKEMNHKEVTKNVRNDNHRVENVLGADEDAEQPEADADGSVLRPDDGSSTHGGSGSGRQPGTLGEGTKEVPSGSETTGVSGSDGHRRAGKPSGRRRGTRMGDAGVAGEATGSGAGRDRDDEGDGSADVGRQDEQHPAAGNGDHPGRSHSGVVPEDPSGSPEVPAIPSEYPAQMPPEQEPEQMNFAELVPIGDLENPNAKAPQLTPMNHRITTDTLGVGTASEKYRANMAAIRCLKAIEAENRQATPSEQEILSRYVGWGSLAAVFEEKHSRYNELKQLLSPGEYSAARASVLDAHYTSPVIIRAIYAAVQQMGFAGGRILEPSMGIGNFFGMLPETMAASTLHGVELDDLTGRIAKQLYPNAQITIAGFETTKQHNYYDLAIGNVPFGQVKVNDSELNQWNFSIHNYFFAKAIEQVRPGGIIAFLTSRYTMDSKSSKARKYIAQRAELLGAIRLPNNAFLANAGTEVVSDILFLQKRESPVKADPSWLHIGQTEDGYPINQYYVDHPEMILGKLGWKSTPYGKDECTVNPIPDADLGELLDTAILNVHGLYRPFEPENDASEGTLAADTLPADPTLRPWSYSVRNGRIYFQEDGDLILQDVGKTAAARIQGMIEIRDSVRQLINMQLSELTTDEQLIEPRAKLNQLYDSFVKDYGRLYARGNKIAFRNDAAYPLLLSLEILDDEGEFVGKADIFSKRTIRPRTPVAHVETASEALAVSIGERAAVDIDYMAELTGKTPQELEDALIGIIYRDVVCDTDPKRIPFSACKLEYYRLVTADEYLSGNVRQKLRMARSLLDALPSDKRRYIQSNVTALEAAQPAELTASEISVRLGATWIPVDIIRDFLIETFKPQKRSIPYIKVEYSEITGEWHVDGDAFVTRNDINATVTFGTKRINAYELVERTLNLREVKIYDTIHTSDGVVREFNPKETTLAQQRQQLIHDTFKDWIWEDPERRQRLVSIYNEQFNSTRPREYDGSHLVLGDINPEIKLRPHQLAAIAHTIYGGNTLLAHAVGAGKTFEIVASIMASKRLGLCQKAMIAVPNHLTDQWGAEFLSLYPAANVLIATEADFEKQNRRKFFARIATGDYDAVILGHSQFERISVSPERQRTWIQAEIDELENNIDTLRSQRSGYYTIKQLELQKKNLQTKLQKMLDKPKDDFIAFEELGIDRLCVDEAHAYKNLFCPTKMTRVAGISTSESQRATDMLMKCRLMDEVTNERGIIFATGTPVSNSMTELYTMQRYLQYSRLKELGLANFDSWASVFGETVTAMELAPEGTGYRMRTRFARFFNLPELMSIFKEVADIKMADQLNLPTPEAVYQTVVCTPTEAQKDMVKELSERASAIHAGSVDPSEDNMLKITSDGRKLGLDQRIINPFLPDDPRSKVNQCVSRVFQWWQDGAEKKLTQLIFCDLSTPKKASKKEDGWSVPAFSVYTDIRDKLIKKGIPADEIAFIHDADTSAKKRKLFKKVRSGEVRVLMGSTQKMGAGTNVQDRLIASHDLDCPWRPGDLEQRAGRIVRQGNRNPTVYIERYVTEGTFDAYLWQTIETKQRFISQVMTSKTPVRSMEDVDDSALAYAEIKALCAGDPRVKEKMDLDVAVAKLRVLKAGWQSQRYALQDQLLRSFPAQVEHLTSLIAALKADLDTLNNHPEPSKNFVGIEIAGHTYTDKQAAGSALIEQCKLHQGTSGKVIGSFRGLALELDSQLGHTLFLRGQAMHKVSLGIDPLGNFIRISNVLSAVPQRITATENQLSEVQKQIVNAKAELEKPFAQETELMEKSWRLTALNAELNMASMTTPKRSKENSIEDNEVPSI